MMKQFPTLAAILAVTIGSVRAKEPASTDVAVWMDAALDGKLLPVPEDGDALVRGDVAAEEASLWKAYKDAARRAGWDKQLLGVPASVGEMIKGNGKLEIKASQLRSGDKVMPYTFMVKGEKPEAGWPLFISMHGGGRHHGKGEIEAHGWDVNSREWQAQMNLTAKVYKPAGLYFLPRMADDRMGRWWHKHNIDIFTRMIRHAILFNEVDPNRIYIMGISQGGYGSCHLAPLLADQFAAAGPMAGGMMTVTENLRNLPFRSDIGEFDKAYDRIKLANKLHDRIDSHKTDDPEGYKNLLAIQKGKGHGIDYSKSPAWLAVQTRDPHPGKVVWRCHGKDGIFRESFYWISLTDPPTKGEISIVATLDKDANSVEVIAEEIIPSEEKGVAAMRRPLESSKIIVHLNDKMLDLDKEIAVQLNGVEAFKGMIERSRGTMMRNLVKRGDVNYAVPAEVIVGKE